MSWSSVRELTMARLSVAAATAFVIAGCGTTSPPRAPAPVPLSDAVEPQAVLRAMTTVAAWQLANPSAHKPYEWHGAPFWAGLYELAVRSSSRQKYLDAIRRNGESVQWQPGPQPFLADDHAVTQSYFLLYRLEHNRRMIEPALARFGEMLQAPFAESLEFSDDKTLREWVWCDALFMSPPALALATSVTGDRRYADLMDRLWWKTTDYLYDKQERLFYRDSRFFDQRERNGRKLFWSRGNGWVLAGLAIRCAISWNKATRRPRPS